MIFLFFLLSAFTASAHSQDFSDELNRKDRDGHYILEGKRDIEAQKLAIEAYKAETERMTALSPAMGPEQIQALVLQTLQQLSSPNDLPEVEGADGPTDMMSEPESMPAY
jgi:hypothetical protein